MIRISRLRAPRASFCALALVAAFVFAFYMAAQVGHANTALANGAPNAAPTEPAIQSATPPSTPSRLLPCLTP